MIERETSLPWALHTNFNVEDETNHDRTEKPVVCRDSWCKSRAINGKRGWHRLQNSWIATFCCETSWQRSCSWTCQEDRESPHRLSRQQDLQQNSLRPVQYESQENDSGHGAIVELFGLFETDPKTQCKECFSYWSEGIVWCTCGSLERKCSEPRRHPTNIGPFLSVPDYVIKKGTTSWRQIWESFRTERIFLVHYLKKRDAPRSFEDWFGDFFLSRSYFPWKDARKQSRWRCLSWMERSCRTRFHLSDVRDIILSLQTKLMDLHL